MAIPAESRNTVRHLINIKLPYSYEDPDFRFINEGVTELTESYEAETDDVQYIGEKAKTTNIKGISRSFDLEMLYIQNDPIQDWMSRIFRNPLTGDKSRCDYVRLNILEPVYGEDDAYIAVRSRATVQPVSIGGSSTDSMTTAVKINASGDPKIGIIHIDGKDTDNPQFIWSDADLEAPIITYPITKTKVLGNKIEVSGTATPNKYVCVVYGYGKDKVTECKLVDSMGNWSIELDLENKVKQSTVKIAARLYDTSLKGGACSVTSTPIIFDTNIGRIIAPPTIDKPIENIVKDTKYTLTGKGLAKHTLYLYDGDTELVTLPIPDTKYWSYEHTFTTTGAHTLTAKQTKDGTESKKCDGVVINVLETAPTT